MKILKVGDKLLCKQTAGSLTASVTVNDFVILLIKKTKYYTITDIVLEEKIVLPAEILISVMVINNIICFSLDPNSNWYLWNYFYTPQEIRKMKLKQLK